MTVLRSREVPSVPAKPQSKARSSIEPVTPVRTREPNGHRPPAAGSILAGPEPGSGLVDGPAANTRRRSLRLASKCDGGEYKFESENGGSRVSGAESIENEASVSVSEKWTKRKRRLNANDGSVSVIGDDAEGKSVLSLRSGKKVAKRTVDNGVWVEEFRSVEMEIGSRGSEALGIEVGSLDFKNKTMNSDGKINGLVEEKEEEKKVVTVEILDNIGEIDLDKGKDGLLVNGKFDVEARLGTGGSKERNPGSKKKGKIVPGDLVEETIESKNPENDVLDGAYLESQSKSANESSKRTAKGKGKVVIADTNGNDVIGVLVENSAKVGSVVTETSDDKSKMKGKGLLEGVSEDGDASKKHEEDFDKSSSSTRRRRYTREEKGKGLLVENLSLPKSDENVGVSVEMELKKSINDDAAETEGTVEHNEENTTVNESNERRNHGENRNGSRIGQFHDIARRNASRFAHFEAEGDEEDDLSDEGPEQQTEDWPGPFSTAMKIIKDRENNIDLQIGASVFNRTESTPPIWVPKRDQSFVPRKPFPPSLLELSMKFLARNADAIISLDYVPDALRHRLCQLLCDSRRMNVHFLDLLLRGFPTGIFLPDCSWLAEEQFTECFKSCDTSSLTVLQLDHSGRCMPDYVLLSTLARSPNGLPVLSSLSLIGACRLSDVGLRALVSAAPAMRSINLSQCSLLTSSSIDILSNSLGSVLRELYLDDCQGIDLKLILPALNKLEKLELLSLAGLQSVGDRFVREFVTARGKNLKELILTDCVKLTDSSVKVISENCPILSVLDLANLYKLTDSSLGYLANGCRAIEILNLRRNSSFSDEAVAAFLETSGDCLKELSLNNIKKVGHNTALSLAKHSRKLQTLDLSWCRDLKDNALGYIVDNCSSLTVLKLFGCTQITNVFMEGHSNPNVKIIGLKMSPVLDHLKVPVHLDAT